MQQGETTSTIMTATATPSERPFMHRLTIPLFATGFAMGPFLSDGVLARRGAARPAPLKNVRSMIRTLF